MTGVPPMAVRVTRAELVEVASLARRMWDMYKGIPRDEQSEEEKRQLRLALSYLALVNLFYEADQVAAAASRCCDAGAFGEEEQEKAFGRLTAAVKTWRKGMI